MLPIWNELLPNNLGLVPFIFPGFFFICHYGRHSIKSSSWKLNFVLVYVLARNIRMCFCFFAPTSPGLENGIDAFGSVKQLLMPDAGLELCDAMCSPGHVSVTVELDTSHIGRGCDRESYSMPTHRKLCGNLSLECQPFSLVLILHLMVQVWKWTYFVDII